MDQSLSLPEPSSDNRANRNEKLVDWYNKYLVYGFLKVRDQLHREHIILDYQGDVQEVMMIATTMYHFQEHLPKDLQISKDNVIDDCADYALLGDAVNAWKHRSIAASWNRRIRIVTTVDQICETVAIHWNDDLKAVDKVHKLIYLDISNGMQRDMLDILATVLNYWEQYLYNARVIRTCRRFKHQC